MSGKWVMRFLAANGLFWLILCALVFYDIYTIWRRFKEYEAYVLS